MRRVFASRFTERRPLNLTHCVPGRVDAELAKETRDGFLRLAERAEALEVRAVHGGAPARDLGNAGHGIKAVFTRGGPRRHALPEPAVGERCALCRDILQEARIDNPHKARARCPLVLVVAAKLHAVARGGDVQDDEMRPVLLVVHGGHVPGAMGAPEAHGAAMGKCFEHAARRRRDGPRPVGVERLAELGACHHRVQCSAEKLGVKRKN